MANKAFLSVSPMRQTSAVQGVFGVTLGTGVEWEPGTIIKHTLDGKSDTFTVPEGQHATPVYLPYHDLKVGVHEWDGEVTFLDKTTSPLYPFTWEIVEAPAQTPSSDEVAIQGTITGTGTARG